MEIYGDFVAVKQQCQETTTQLIIELQGQFPAQDLLDALGIVYAQYWLKPKLEKRFIVQALAIIKTSFYHPKK
jgi:hypothetical protein